MIVSIPLIILLVSLSVTIAWICRKFKPYVEFTRKHKHRSGFPLELLKVGYEDSYEKLIGPTLRSGYDSFWFGQNFAVNLKNPEDIKIAMNSELCFEKHSTYEFFFKYGLLSIGGNEYRWHRKLMNPLFTPANVRNLIPIINEETSSFLQNYAVLLESQQIDMRRLMGKFTLRTVIRTFFGLHSYELTDQMVEKILTYADEFMLSSSARVFKPWTHPNFVYKFTKEYRDKKTYFNFFSKVLERTKREYNEQQIDGVTFISCMKEALDEMSDFEYQETLSLFIGAAYETTAGTVSSALFLLGNNPEKQENLFNEVSSILNSHDEEVTMDQISQMPYLDLVIKETMRLLPNNIFITRNTAEDVQFSNFTVPKNSMVIFPTLEIHRNRFIWGTDAMKFEPERFTDEKFKKIHPYAFIPFSNGPRSCPGQRYALITLKIFLSRFIMKYRVSSETKYVDLEYLFGMTLDFKKRPLINVTRRVCT